MKYRMDVSFFCKQKTAYEIEYGLVGSEDVYKRQAKAPPGHGGALGLSANGRIGPSARFVQPAESHHNARTTQKIAGAAAVAAEARPCAGAGAGAPAAPNTLSRSSKCLVLSSELTHASLQLKTRNSKLRTFSG